VLHSSLIKIIILEENFKWHLEAFGSELFICINQENQYEVALSVTDLKNIKAGIKNPKLLTGRTITGYKGFFGKILLI